MENEKEYLNEAHTNDMEWRKAMEFYKNEVAYMRKKLEEVNAANTNKEFKMLVSHFENHFLIQHEIIDEIKHAINVREDYIARRMKANPEGYEYRVIRLHSELKGKIEVFEKLFGELKKSFDRFLSERL